MKVGYIRVSTVEQNTERQLENVQVEKVFEEKKSGKDMNRPKLQEMLNFAREGDHIFVHSMDRLARNVRDLLGIVSEIKNKGATITFVKENMSFSANQSSNPMQELMLTMLGAIAEFERKLILERQREGIAVAKNKGRYKGSSKRLSQTEVDLLKQIYLKKEMTVEELGKKFNLSRKSVYNYLKL